MGLLTWIKEKFKMLFKTDAEKAFGVETYLSPEMENAIKLWEQLESGKPPWLKDSDGRTVAFWNTIAEEWAKLITQNIDVKVQDKFSKGEMPEKMQKILDSYFLQNAKDNIHTMIFWGGVMIKWDGKGTEYLRPDMFLVTEFDSNKDVQAAIFFSYYSKGKKFYTKAEWHRFETETRHNEAGESETIRIYHVSTKAFLSDNRDEIGREVPLKSTKWADIEPEFWAENLKKPLFRYIKCPVYNFIDTDSPLGIPCFANCIEEFRMLDIAMSTLGKETKNSSPVMMIDQSAIMYANQNGIELPEFIDKTGLDLSDSNSPVEQWQPTLQIASRKEGINFYLSIIGFKCGFDPGYFVFDGQNIQATTATQVRVTQKRTSDTALSYRDVLDKPNSNGDGRVGAIHDIAYIINAMLIINGEVAPSENGNYKLFCSFADLLKNEEEDAMLDKQLADTGYIPRWKWLVLHRGYTEEEAKAMVAEASLESIGNEQEGLFSDEFYNTQPVAQEEKEAESRSGGLNGAQTQSLISIIQQLSAGTITEGQAINLIATAIGISKEEARKILAGEI